LILSLGFLFFVSVIVLALASWTFNNLDNTLQFQSVSARLYAAEGATQVAMRAARYTYAPSGAKQCPAAAPSSMNGLYVIDWCVTYIPPVNLGATTTISREVTLTACEVPSANSTLSSNCSGNAVLLTALVYIDDNDAHGLDTCPTSVATISTCGHTMSIVSWVPGA
jgi:hypothetical protein